MSAEDGFAAFLSFNAIRESILFRLDAFRAADAARDLDAWTRLRRWLADLTETESKMFPHLRSGTVARGDRLVTGEMVLDDLCGELVAALQEASGQHDPRDRIELLALLDVTEGLVLLSEHCKRRLSMEPHWFSLVLGLLENPDPEVVAAVIDLVQAVVSESSAASRVSCVKLFTLHDSESDGSAAL